MLFETDDNMNKMRCKMTTFKSTHGTHLAYRHIPSTRRNTTMLFIHGFPSHKEDWSGQQEYFVDRDYGVLLVDLPGFGDSKMGNRDAVLRQKTISAELVELLDHEGIEQPVVGVGHDIGAIMLSRLAMYHPDRIQAMVYLSVGPHKPGIKFDVDAINKATREMMGFEYVGYICWIARDPGAAACLEENAETVMKLLFAKDEGSWMKWFRPVNAMERCVKGKMDLEIADWYTAQQQSEHLRVYSVKGGSAGAVRWYQMMDQNICLPDEEGYTGFKTAKPALLIVPVAEAEQQAQMANDWHDHLELQTLQSGHWVHLERAEEVNARTERFLVQHGLDSLRAEDH